MTLIPNAGLSLVTGATDVPLSDQTIAELLTATVAAHPDAEAVVFREQGIRWTWRQFSQQVDRLATGLLQRGIARGDRVGI
ncbi:AMP-binding protein, partial [Salmonella enterica]|nr:AMP-binding protein [Salmonella enterica]